MLVTEYCELGDLYHAIAAQEEEHCNSEFSWYRRLEFIRYIAWAWSCEIYCMHVCLQFYLRALHVIESQYMTVPSDSHIVIKLKRQSDTRRLCNLRRGHRIALDVAKGLHALHSRQIIHFDVKSPNVLLTVDMVAKVADVVSVSFYQLYLISVLSEGAGLCNCIGTLYECTYLSIYRSGCSI